MEKIDFLGKNEIKKENSKKVNKFRPNLSLGACLAMCLFFEETEPSVLINRVLTKKNKCIRVFVPASHLSCYKGHQIRI